MNIINNREKKESDSCTCTSMRGLFLPNRQASAVVAGMVMLVAASFMSGYFFGKKQSVEAFSNRVDQDQFADQIFSSVCAFADHDPQDIESISAQESEQVDATENDQSCNIVQQAQVVGQQGEEVSTDYLQRDNDKSYYAQLIGFGTVRSAQRFAQKLQSKGMSVVVKTRRSKTAKGRKIAWYQVVTQTFNDRLELENLVDRISKEETLKGVHIVTN